MDDLMFGLADGIFEEMKHSEAHGRSPFSQDWMTCGQARPVPSMNETPQ
jgi:hypothetical protein